LPKHSQQSRLPAAIEKPLRAQVPRDAVSLLVIDASGKQPPRLSLRVDAADDPASVMQPPPARKLAKCWVTPHLENQNRAGW
jgi:D-alanyl-D-alanine carboxypeptidase/D-alanyl-D-alanine-endopeptidase (penicillin-binding protein 4)